MLPLVINSPSTYILRFWVSTVTVSICHSEPIEVLEVGLSLPDGVIEKVGVNSQQRFVVAVGGKKYAFVDDDLLEWREMNEEVRWSQSKELDEWQYDQFQQAIIGKGFPLDRVILDFHSGNIFGLLGKVLVDLFSIGLLGLSISGVLLLSKSKRRKREQKGL